MKLGKPMKASLLAVGVFFLLTGCMTTRVTDFTAISTKNVALDAPRGKRVQGKDCNGWGGMPNMKAAIDKAIESAGGEGDMLIDGVLTLEQGWMPCYIVEGTIVNTRDLKTGTPVSKR
jgi:hypothetical protein